MKDRIRKAILKYVPAGTDFDVSVSPRAEMGHYSTNAAMRIAKTEGKKPLEVAQALAAELTKEDLFERVEAAPPGFVNFWIKQELLQQALTAISKDKNFGKSTVGKGKTVIVEYSQPNIAKKMHVGHLRTTVMGDALANMYEWIGYKVVRWNYLGDWGTQFGKLIAAYKLWGSKEEVEKNPIETLLALYVKFHDEAKTNPELDEQGRQEFQKLEEGDAENRKLWEWFKKESLKEFEKIYRILGIRFDVEIGESFFENDMKPLVEELLKSGVAKESEGSIIVPLDSVNLPPALVRKSDGASLYLTRDIANLRYRLKQYKPAKVLYVVGNEQSLHFEQVFAVANILGLGKGIELAHVKYGLVLAEGGKKFATREGRSVFLEDVIDKAVRLARTVVEEKNKDLSAKEKEEVAQAVAIGALKYTNLKENRHSDIVFDWNRMLDFRGDSAPYLQYTYARLRSIQRKAGKISGGDPKHLTEADEIDLIRKMMDFPDAICEGAEAYSTNTLSTYLYELANLANTFYEHTPILIDSDEERKHARLLLIDTVASVLERGLGMLGIKTLEKI